jgi:hypothetical protein
MPRTQRAPEKPVRVVVRAGDDGREQLALEALLDRVHPVENARRCAHGAVRVLL